MPKRGSNGAVPKRPSVQDECDRVCARVARSLQQERVAKELSMTRVAEGAGLSRQMISFVESGKRVPTLDTLLRIAMALEIDLSEVIREAQRPD